MLSADANRSAIGLVSQGQDHKRVISLMAYREGVELVLMKHVEAPLFLARVDDTGSTLLMSDGREPSQRPRSILLRNTSPTEDLQGGTMINLRNGPRNEDIRAGLLVSENEKAASLVLSGDDGKLVNIRVNQKDGEVGFFNENNKAVFTMP